MAFQVRLIFADASTESVEETADLGEACEFAFALADKKGLHPGGDGHGPPVKVDVYRDDRLEISIRIVRGGLRGRKDDPKLRSM